MPFDPASAISKPRPLIFPSIEPVNYSRGMSTAPAGHAPPDDAASEAWALMVQLVVSERSRFAAAAAEFDLSPMQAHVLRLLAPGRELPMSALAGALACDASNVTGIVDRLEARGLIARHGAPRDRRIKLLAITEAGAGVRADLLGRAFRPPASLAALAGDDLDALRAILRRAADAALPATR
jgi:MarR family transcriptional regulator, organic hydroperoxide resistance regulator